MNILKWCMIVLALLFFSFSVFAWCNAWWPKINRTNPYMTTTDHGNVKWVQVIGNDKGKDDALVNVIKWWVNWVLWILALIALIILMYGWFLMVTAAWDDEKYKKWWTILKHAAIWLILIGVAWFIISIIFWLVNKTAFNAGAANSDQ